MTAALIHGTGPWRFARFLLTGGFNAVMGIALSALVNVVLQAPVASFVTGYALSLVISYFVNAVFVFSQRKFSFAQFLRFCLSYVPNFTIQLVAVHVLVDRFGLLPVVAYTLAVVIAVPVTYVLLSVFAFGRKGLGK